MRWGHPGVLYLLSLLPAIAVFFVWARRKKRRDLGLFAGTKLEQVLTRNLSGWRQTAKDVFLILSLTLLVIAWARPQWGERWEETKRRGVDIFVAVDLSKSMMAGDVSPSRLERARRKLTDLVPILEGDRIGLIAFAGQAFVLMPLTLDYNVLPLYIESLTPDALTVPGTAVASAIDLALGSFEKEGPSVSHAVILITDGEDLSGEVKKAVETASSKGIQINALGIGTPEGAPIPETGGGFKKDGSGQLVLTRLDETSLQEMARETGGVYVRSVAGDDDLNLIYQTIRRGREEKELKGGKERRFMERYQWFLAFAILLLILEAIMKETTRDKKASAATVVLIMLGVLSLPQSASAFGTIGTIREGEKLYQAGKYDEALQKFLEAQKKRPDDPRLQYNLGNTYHQLKRYEDAGKIFSKENEGAGNAFQERNLYNLGNNQYRQGSLEEAIHSYEEALKLDPKDEDAQYNLDLVRKQREQQKEQEQQKQQDQQNQQDQQKQESKDQQQKDQGNQDKNQQQQDQQRDSQQGKQDKGQEPQGSQGKQDAKSAQVTKVSPEEAKRWLSGLKEGRPRVYTGGDKKGNGKRNVEKDW